MFEWIKEWWFLLVVAIILGLMALVEFGCVGNRAVITKTETVDLTPTTDKAKTDVLVSRAKYDAVVSKYKARIEGLTSDKKYIGIFSAIIGIGAILCILVSHKIGLAIMIGGLLAGCAVGGLKAVAIHPITPYFCYGMVGLLVMYAVRKGWVKEQATAKLVEYGEHVKAYREKSNLDRIEDWEENRRPKSKAVQKEIDKVIKKNGK